MATQNTVTNPVINPIKLQAMSLEALKNLAEEIGVQVTESSDASDIVAAIVEASAGANTKPEPGVLIALHSGTDAAKAFVYEARNAIFTNADAGRKFKLFLQNQEGNFYTRTEEGVRVSPSRMQECLKYLRLLDDKSQDEIVQGYKDNPDDYQQPLLVRVRKWSKSTNSYTHYVMLYLRKKSQRVEQVF